MKQVLPGHRIFMINSKKQRTVKINSGLTLKTSILLSGCVLLDCLILESFGDALIIHWKREHIKLKLEIIMMLIYMRVRKALF